MKPLPRLLYKYRPFNTFSLRLLILGEFYYADPKRFNDPLDCDPTVEVDIDLKNLEQLCYTLLTCKMPKKDAEAQINNLRYLSSEYGDYRTDPDVENYLTRMLARDIKRLLDEEMETRGILSLSATWDSPLMWSHYADEHRGICIEYDTAEIPHPNLAAVDYRSPRSVKTSDLVAWKMNQSEDAERRVYNTYFFAKSSQWRYEREWRDISNVSGPGDAALRLTAIHFGLRCDPAVIISVVKLLSTNRAVKLFEIYPLDDSFRLKRRRVEQDEIEARDLRTSALLEFKDVFLPVDADHGAN